MTEPSYSERLANKIADAVLELLQAIPKPDKEDLTFCIIRAIEEPEKVIGGVVLSNEDSRETLEER